MPRRLIEEEVTIPETAQLPFDHFAGRSRFPGLSTSTSRLPSAEHCPEFAVQLIVPSRRNCDDAVRGAAKSGILLSAHRS
jgi:hypothetical protein